MFEKREKKMSDAVDDVCICVLFLSLSIFLSHAFISYVEQTVVRYLAELLAYHQDNTPISFDIDSSTCAMVASTSLLFCYLCQAYHRHERGSSGHDKTKKDFSRIVISNNKMISLANFDGISIEFDSVVIFIDIGDS